MIFTTVIQHAGFLACIYIYIYAYEYASTYRKVERQRDRERQRERERERERDRDLVDICPSDGPSHVCIGSIE